MTHGLIRGSVAIAAACLIAFRLGTDISPESHQFVLDKFKSGHWIGS